MRVCMLMARLGKWKWLMGPERQSALWELQEKKGEAGRPRVHLYQRTLRFLKGY